jgi:sn-glycerol 3-phosphate transport system substrate-binding protein
MKMKKFFCVLTLMLSFSFIPTVQATTEIYWWHSMEGELGKSLEALVSKYNNSQTTYKIIPTYRGNYTESLNASIAAFRARKQPHIIQVFEVGTQTMMNSGTIYPIQDLLNDNKVAVNWDDFLPPIVSYYRDSKGKLLSMPFNSSTPIMFYNLDMFKKAGIKNPPATWQELREDSKKLIKSGAKCGTVIGWQQWILLENFSAIHNMPFASNENGFGSISPKLLYNTPAVVKNIQMLKDMMPDNSFRYEGRRSDPAKKVFLAGLCGIYMDSSSSIGGIKKVANFKWSAAPLPYNEGTTKPLNGMIGGATLWVFKGHRPAEYKGIAEFIAFLAKSENQIWWHKETGYLPITKTAYEELKKENYFQKEPFQEVAIKQLLRGTPTINSRGLRLGNYTQIRDVMDEELEKIWSGKSTPEEGIKNSVERGNRLLEQYARMTRQ